jgi:hypothetical protein
MFLAATALLTWFAIRPAASKTTDTHASDNAIPVEA